MWTFQAFIGCFQRSRTPASFHMYSRQAFARSDPAAPARRPAAHSLKCTAPQLFPSIGGYLQVQKKGT